MMSVMSSLVNFGVIISFVPSEHSFVTDCALSMPNNCWIAFTSRAVYKMISKTKTTKARTLGVASSESDLSTPFFETIKKVTL